jgi:hypothetical protein
LHPNAQPLEEAQRQLQLLLQQQDELAPGLYRDLALYLQVLREGLLPAVQQACFHVATQVVPERYGQLPEERRLLFQQRLATLVQRCNALLTVEQLMGLAAQQQRRDHRHRSVRRQRLLDAFLEGAEAQADDDDPDPQAAAAPSPPSATRRPPSQNPDAPGSIHLGLDLPLSADLFDRGIAGLPGAAEQPELFEPPALEPSEAGERAEESADVDDDVPPGRSELKMLQSLFQMAAEELGHEGLLPQDQVAPGAAAAEPADGRINLAMPAALEPASPLDPDLTGSGLPRDPLRQVSWWRHFDRALSRRLRNLSHALNVEMMRLGLAQGLLPLNLLDAVLEGQVEALPAPVNLLRLPLPLPSGHGGPTEVLAILLRPGDLEFDQPRLRTCRQRLEQRRRALRTMAKRYRIWQRRVTALEAEQQWFQDSAQLQSRPLPPS